MSKDSFDRRAFLKGAAATAAAVIGTQVAATNSPAQGAESNGEPKDGAQTRDKIIGRPGSDYMVDVIKATGMEYIASNPGSSFRSLQESIINYGGNKKPEFLTCTHEESSVAMAHGYAKASGKPMGILAHGTVGLQHATMAVYNAWCDRVPVMMFAGNFLDANTRRPGVEWYHCVQDPAAIHRDFTKWDDQPVSLQHFAESVMRAYKIATTPPMGPVLITADGDLAEEPVHDEKKLRMPKLTMSIPPQGDSGAVTEAAKLLVAAQNPVILADRACRSQEGMKRIVELAEALNAPVADIGGRMNFPTSHYLCRSLDKRSLVGQADVVLMLEVADPWGQFNTISDPHHEYRRLSKPGCQNHSHFPRRHSDESELSRHAAVYAGGSGDLRRCAGDTAGIDRGGKERRGYVPARRNSRARDQTARRPSPHEGPGACGGEPGLGCDPVQHRAHVRTVVQRDQERKMVRCRFQHAMEQEPMAGDRVL